MIYFGKTGEEILRAIKIMELFEWTDILEPLLLEAEKTRLTRTVMLSKNRLAEISRELRELTK